MINFIQLNKPIKSSQMTALEYIENSNSSIDSSTKSSSSALNQIDCKNSKILTINTSNTTEQNTPPQSPNLVQLKTMSSASSPRLTLVDQIIQDERLVDVDVDEVDASLLPIIQTPPQSAGSSSMLTLNLNHYSNRQIMNNSKLHYLNNYKKLDESFRSNLIDLKQNLKNIHKRFRNIQKKDFLITANEHDLVELKMELNYELNKEKDNDENMLTDEDEDDKEEIEVNVTENDLNEARSDLYWDLRRVRLGSEWQRVKTKLNLIKKKNTDFNTVNKAFINNNNKNNKNTKLFNLNNCFDINTYETSLDHFRTNLFKNVCSCNPDQSCIFCHFYKLTNNKKELSQNLTKIQANEKLVNFYHSYPKKPANTNKNMPNNNENKNETKTNKTSTNTNNSSSFLNDLNLIDDDLLNNLVNERLNNLFNNSNNKPNSSNNKNGLKQLPNFSYEELEFLCDDNSSAEIDRNKTQISSNMLNDKKRYINYTESQSIKHYDQTKFKKLRYNIKSSNRKTRIDSINNSENINPTININRASCKRKRSDRSTSSTKSNASQETYLNKSNNKYDIDDFIIPDEMFTRQKINIINKPTQVVTPKWREIDIEPLDNDPNLIPEELVEDLLDSSYSNRHDLVHINEINKKSDKLNQDDLIEKSSSALTSEILIKNSYGWTARIFPLNDQEYQQMIDLDQ